MNHSNFDKNNYFVTYIKPEAILIVNATNVVLKKNAKTQCIKPVLRIDLVVKLTSAVWPEVPITQAK